MYSGLNNILNSVSPNITDALFTKYVNQVKDAGPLHQIWIRPVTVLVCASLTVIQLAEVVSRVAFAAILLIPFLVSFAFSDENATQFREKFEEQFSPGNLAGQILGIALLPTAITIDLIFTGIYSESEPSDSKSASSDRTPPPTHAHPSTGERVTSWRPLPPQLPLHTVRHDGSSPVRALQLESEATHTPPPAASQLSLPDTATLRDVSRESSGPQAPQVLADPSSTTGPQRREVTPPPAANILATAAAPAPTSI